MRLHVFAVRDNGAEMFLAPFYVRAKGEAVRTFIDLINDVKSPFSKAPHDFDLYSLGEWDDQNGEFSTAGILKLMSGLDVVASRSVM